MKIKLSAYLGVLGAAILVFGVLLTRAVAAPQGRGLDGTDDIRDTEMTGGVATLYAADPISQSLCFGDGRAGHVFQANEVRNRCTDIDINYYPGSFAVGAEGARIGTIIDLGTSSDLGQRYGFGESRGGGQGFASLRLENGKVVILKDRSSHSVQELKESTVLFQEGKALANAPIKLGHLYLLRITDGYDKTFSRMVKLMVIAYSPEQSVTIRWHLL